MKLIRKSRMLPGIIVAAFLAVGGAVQAGGLQENPVYTKRLQVASPQVKAQVQTLRTLAVQRKWTFQVGATGVADKPLAQITGLKLPDNLEAIATEQNQFADKALALDRQYLIAKKIPIRALPCVATASVCNLQGKMTPVRDQRSCGSCWDFAGMGAYEGSYNILYNRLIDVSEQHILSCSHAGSCAGGWWDPVYQWMMGTAVRSEAQEPYTATDAPCKPNPAGLYKVAAWGFVTVKAQVPPVAAIKAAIAAHGPLAVAVRATSAFQHYTGGVFNENDTGPINHGIVIVGWDDGKGAWLIRNSWYLWGINQGGYMWIKYGSNSVGYAATWVRPSAPGLVINPALLDLLRRTQFRYSPLRT